MNKKNTNYLLDTYPDLYIQHKLPMTQTCMCWLFECGDGWFKIIDNLSKQLSKHKGCEATQVKEKFGTLRFYYIVMDDDGDYEKIANLVNEAEELSGETCEECGKPGKLRGTCWLVTLCDKCWDIREIK